MVEFTNSFGQLTSSLLKTMFGPIYIAVIALGINLVISFGGSMIQKKMDIKKNAEQ